MDFGAEKCGGAPSIDIDDDVDDDSDHGTYDSVQHVRPDCVVVGVVATIVVISSDDDNVRCDFCSSNRGCQLLHSLRVTLLGPEW